MTDSLPTHPESTDSPAEGGAVAWRKRMNETHPIGLVQPSDWRFSQHKPALEDGMKPEWFDIQPLFTRPAPIEPGVREKVAYRLLGRGDIIQHGDQHLADDCETWRELAGWEVGVSYSPEILMPFRRPSNTGEE